MIYPENPNSHMYVLRLKANKWYAGLTSDLEDTIKNHFEGEDDIWTKTYPPRSVDTVMTFHTVMPAHKAIVILNKKLKELYDEYGYDNVRGLQYPS
ncbi:putative endonuclease [candidate division TM7 genomosp. GTL1]|nr:putative endonuclease [candidate division TM7 genomosp. GTL1]